MREHWTCPECGPHVSADEDGCCTHCGADCAAGLCDCTRDAYLSGVRAGLEAAEDWLRGRGHHDLAASLSMGAKELADLIAEVSFMSAKPIAKEAADAAE